MSKPAIPKHPKEVRLKRVSVSISHTSTEGTGSKSTSSTRAVMAFGKTTDTAEANKQVILSGLVELFTLAALEGFPEEAQDTMGSVLKRLRKEGLVP